MKDSKVLFGFLSILFLCPPTIQASTVNVSLDPSNWSTFGTVTSSYLKQNVSGNLRFTCNTYRGYIGFRSNETFNLQGATVRYKWRANSGSYCWTKNGISQAYGFGHYFNLSWVWDVGILISTNTWIYTELVFNKNKTYTWNYSYTGYGKGGIFAGSGTFTQAQYDALTSAYIVSQGGDNYATPYYYEFGEIQVTPEYKPLTVDINSPGTESYYEPNELITFDSTAHGGDEPYAYEWSSDIDGVISNAKTFDISTLSLGRHNITLTCHDANAVIAADSIYIYVIEPPVIDAIGDATIREGAPYTGPQPILLQGTYVTWQLVDGPPGMTINSSTGVVSWPDPTLNEEGITVTIKALNFVGSSQQSWQLFILRPPVIADIADDSVRINNPYTGPIPVLTQSSLPVIWSLVSGPAGITIDAATGQVSWPNASIEGPHTITIRATNAVGLDDETWQLKVWVPPVVGEIVDLAIRAGVAYNGPAPVLLSGTMPVNWQLDAGPADMTISSSGVVSWSNPAPENSEHIVTITAVNFAGSDSESWNLRVMLPPQINAMSDAVVNEGTAYAGDTPELLAGTAPITWAIVSGPSGLKIDTATGVVSWTKVNGAGSPYTITIRATNAVGSAQQSWHLTVLRPPLIVPIPDTSVAAGATYTGPTPNLYQGTPPLTWTLTSRPAGMTIDSATGVVSWFPAVSGGPYNVVIEASNIAGSDTEAWQLIVVESPAIAEITNMVIAAGTPFTSSALVLLAGTQVTWTLDQGPAGMTINSVTGVVSWANPVGPEIPHTITSRATNIAGTDAKTWQLTVLTKPTIQDIADHDAVEMTSYSGPQPALVAGSLPIIWSLVTGPPGMTIDVATGVVQWANPTVAGSPHQVTIRASNAVGSDDEVWYLKISPSYAAEVFADVETAVSPAPVVLSGRAYWLASGSNAPNVPVRLDIFVKGIIRNISVITDASGEFTTTLVPLPGEAGVYRIGANHPYDEFAADQDSFTLYGMQSKPTTMYMRLYPSQPVSGTIKLTNLTDASLSEITAGLVGLPGNLDIQLIYDPNLDGLGTSDVNYTITAMDDSVLNSDVVINFVSSEGATASVSLDVQVAPLNFVVNVFPQSLKAGMVRTEQKLIQFEVSNSGGVPTEELNVLIPQAPWLRLTSPPKIAPLDPGHTAAVGLALEPAADLPLGKYTGTIIIYGNKTNKAIPFEFNCVSNRVGALKITVVDEFTFYAAGAPNVEGAVMTLSDAVTKNLAWSGTTDVSGVLLNDAVTEGYYDLKITADEHGDYTSTVFVAAGVETKITAFMPRQLVKYTWTVSPTVIQDRYTITLDTIFETSVPAPVITIEPAKIDLAQLQDGSMQVNFVVTNHGLVAAEEAHLQFEQDSRYEVILLTEYNGRVEPQTSVVVPAIIRDKEHPLQQRMFAMAGGAVAASSDQEDCERHFRGGVYYTLVCGDDKKWHYVPVYVGFWVCPGNQVANAVREGPPADTGNEGDGDANKPPDPNPGTGGTGGSSGRNSGSGGEVGGGGGAGSGPGNPIVSHNFININLEGTACDPCPAKRLAAIASCAVSFLPLNCPLSIIQGAYDCASSCTTKGVWSLECLKGCSGAVVGGVSSCIEELSPIGTAWNIIWCVIDIATACDSSDASAFAMAATAYSQVTGEKVTTQMPPDPEYAAEVLREQAYRLQNIMEAMTEVFGNQVWFSASASDSQIQADLIGAFASAISAGSDANEWISEAEKSAMLAMPIPGPMTAADVTYSCERWNRTLDYWQAGLFTAADLDEGANPDFIGADVYQAKWQLAAEAAQQCVAEGFTDIFGGVDSALKELQTALSGPGEGVCAKVALEIKQEAVLSRSAFEAVLDLTNQGGSSLDNLTVAIEIEDANGNSANDLFGIYPPTLTGIPAVDGTANLPGGSDMKAQWIILPTSEAAPIEPVDYYVGGRLIYYIDGLEVVLPLLSDKITVTPDANLVLDYFYEKQVYADDPFTEDVVEPNEPFSLGLIMSNNGAGAAYDMTINSAQPQIIRREADKAILIDFKLIGTQVGSAEVTPSLTVDLGDIEPHSTAVARWLMISSLQGEFVSYKASFEHVDALGDPRLSLIDSIHVHELTHVVRADYPSDDGIVDFLVNDVNDGSGMADTLYLSDGTIKPVDVFTDAVLDVHQEPTTIVVELSVSTGAGWNYIRVPNPVESGLYLVSAIRSDGKTLLTGYNAWTTNRMVRKQGEAPYAEKLIHIFDHAGTGSYTLVFASEPIYGSVKVVLGPAAVVAAGAQWRLDNGDWMDSNDTLEWVTGGTHMLSFNNVNDWTAPAAGQVVITAGQTQELSATYLPAGAQTGSLTVTIEPQQVIDDGAYWRIDGSTIQHGSAEVVTGLMAGTHLLEFSTVDGWVAPNSQEVVIETDQTTATSGTYTKAMYTLVAAVADGNGTLSTVDGEYEAGTVVELTAYPNTGYRVKSWSGTDNVPAAGSISNTVTMNTNKIVSVAFEPPPANAHELDIQTVGGGGDVQPNAGVYDEGAIVILTAHPQDGFRVKSWTGADNVPAPDTNINAVTMTEDKTVTVEFELISMITFTLTTEVLGTGGALAPAGGSYLAGTVVPLVAAPDNGYRVKTWHGSDNDSSTANENAVTMNSSKSVSVEFELIPVTVPAVATITPDSGPVGSFIKITGGNFGDVQGSVVFDGLASDEIISWCDDEIFCKVLTGTAGPNTIDIGIVRADGADCVAVDAFEEVPSAMIYADVNNVSGMENGTMQYPFSRIQRAVNASTSGCNILVLPGIYAGTGNRDVHIIDKIISLRGLNGPTTTIIDCENAARAFYLQDINDANCFIEGFTIRNGFAEGNGGTVYLHSASPTIEQCIIAGSMATGAGGAIFCDGSSPRLINCTIVGNSSTSGRALCCTSGAGCGTAIVTNCILWNSGNEIYTEGCSAVTMSYSEVTGDWPGEGNIDYDPCFADVPANDYHLSPHSPCIDAGDPESDYHLEPEPDGGRINMGAYGNTPEAMCKGGLVLESYNLMNKVRVGRTLFDYTYSITMNNNSTVPVTNVQIELLNAPGNVSIVDPNVTFARIEAKQSATSDNTFTLRINSLVPIDAAMISWRATFEWEGAGGSGHSAFTTKIILSPRTGDLATDGIVDYEDLWRLSDKWLWTGEHGGIPEDINKDGIVDFADFAELAGNWMK